MTITLEQLVRTARATAARDRRRLPERELVARLREAPARRRGRFRDALRGPGLSVIAEVKGASPLEGRLRADLEPVTLARAYAAAGAAAVSVLTEERYFGGALAHLQRVAAAVPLPALRKDFVVEPYQVYQAALAGAAAVLLIADALEAEALRELVALAHACGLDALVEVHDAGAAARAAASGSDLIGVNNRDLRTMRVRWRHCLEVADALPDGVVTVAESGLSEAAQLRAVAAAGYDAVLIGSALVSAPDPGARLRALLEGIG